MHTSPNDALTWRDLGLKLALGAADVISDWNDAYANGAYIQGAEQFPEQWTQRAVLFREEMVAASRARLDLGYGASERERFDLFMPAGPAIGLAVFVHGGYWRMFDKSSWSHLARGAVERGYAVLIPSYTLCPQATIAEITGQVARAISQAAGMVSGPIHLSGHSAGGHLVSRMACALSPLGQGAVSRLGHVLSISGLHDLRPLLKTDLNRELRLDWAMATTESAALQAPRTGTRLTAWVGGDERPEFIRQSELIANIWTGCAVDTSLVIEAGRHHFDVIDGLADASSAMVDHWLSQ